MERKLTCPLPWELIVIRNVKQFNMEDVDCYSAAQSKEMGEGDMYCQPT